MRKRIALEFTVDLPEGQAAEDLVARLVKAVENEHPVAEWTKTRASDPAKRKRQGRPCACGCAEVTGGGLFRPGHDARALGQLKRRVVAGELTAEQAQTEAESAGWSQLLRDKLAASIAQAARKAASKAQAQEAQADVSNASEKPSEAEKAVPSAPKQRTRKAGAAK